MGECGLPTHGDWQGEACGQGCARPSVPPWPGEQGTGKTCWCPADIRMPAWPLGPKQSKGQGPHQSRAVSCQRLGIRQPREGRGEVRDKGDLMDRESSPAVSLHEL